MRIFVYFQIRCSMPVFRVLMKFSSLRYNLEYRLFLSSKFDLFSEKCYNILNLSIHEFCS